MPATDGIKLYIDSLKKAAAGVPLEARRQLLRREFADWRATEERLYFWLTGDACAKPRPTRYSSTEILAALDAIADMIRETDAAKPCWRDGLRALAEAGLMPVAEYLRRAARGMEIDPKDAGLGLVIAAATVCLVIAESGLAHHFLRG